MIRRCFLWNKKDYSTSEECNREISWDSILQKIFCCPLLYPHHPLLKYRYPTTGVTRRPGNRHFRHFKLGSLLSAVYTRCRNSTLKYVFARSNITVSKSEKVGTLRMASGDAVVSTFPLCFA